MKNVVITGAGGFLGGHLVDFFLRQGVEKVIAVLHKENEEMPNQALRRQIQKSELITRMRPEDRERIVFCDVDITNQDDVTTLFHTTQPDTLVHAAALLIPPKESDYVDVLEYKRANARFVEINQAKILADYSAVYQEINPDLYCLLISTIYVFNLNKIGMVTENTAHEPGNSYAKSKDSAQEYWESQGLKKLAIIYPPQIYGPHQFTPAIMPRLIKKMLFDEGVKLTLSGAINPIHVNNMVKLIYTLCQFSEKGCFCVNGDGLMTLEEIAAAIQQAAEHFLAQQNMTPYSAFVVSGTTAPALPMIDDSRLIRFFNSHTKDDPHQPVSFADTADEMIKSHWEHAQDLLSHGIK